MTVGGCLRFLHFLPNVLMVAFESQITSIQEQKCVVAVWVDFERHLF